MPLTTTTARRRRAPGNRSAPPLRRTPSGLGCRRSRRPAAPAARDRPARTAPAAAPGCTRSSAGYSAIVARSARCPPRRSVVSSARAPSATLPAAMAVAAARTDPRGWSAKTRTAPKRRRLRCDRLRESRGIRPGPMPGVSASATYAARCWSTTPRPPAATPPPAPPRALAASTNFQRYSFSSSSPVPAALETARIPAASGACDGRDRRRPAAAGRAW